VDVDDVRRIDPELLADRRRLLAVEEVGDGAGIQFSAGHGRAVDAELGRERHGAGEWARSESVRKEHPESSEAVEGDLEASVTDDRIVRGARHGAVEDAGGSE